VLTAAAVAVMMQTGFLLKTTALAPDIGRLDPRRGLKRLFGFELLLVSWTRSLS